MQMASKMNQLVIQFLERIHGWPLWVQTSYNTRGGKHYKEDGYFSLMINQRH